MAVLLLGYCVFALALNWYYCCVCLAQGWEIRFFLSTTICCDFHDVFQCCVVLMNIPQWHYVLLLIGLVLLLLLLFTVLVGPYVEIRCAMRRLLPDSWWWFCPCSSMAQVRTYSYVVPVHQQGHWWPIILSLYEGGLASVTLCYLIGSANLCMLYIDICDLSF